EVEMLGDEEPERRQQASLRAGEIARDHTDEIDRALRAYIGAAEIGPLPPGRRAELALLHHATGDAAAFALEFERWCDDPESGATAADHVRLAKVLEELARADDALARIERAVEVDPGHAAAWDTAANLREVHGDVEGAADALVRAADLLPDGDAAPRLLRAGELTERRDLDAAESLYRASARRDAANPAVCAALARVCAELGDFPDAVVMAERALDIDSRRGQLEDSLCVDTALIGARAANQRGNGEAAARLYARALAVDPDHADALGEYGETLAGLGDLAGARAAIETRLGLDTDDEHLAMLGAALVAAGETEAATQRLEEAIAVDPSLDRAHEELVALHERAQDVEAGVPCLERWADAANEAPQRALRLLRAAAWEIGSPGREESSERHLRQVLEVAPEFSRAWTLLATFLWDQGRGDDALEIATQALASVCDPDTRGRLALIQGRALEQRGDRREAAGAFVTAAVETPDCIEAALSAARLLRGLGEWQLAADTLRAFAENHPGGDVPGLADVLQQLGRLLAGPLEDVDGAIAAYRSAVDLDPERVDTRTALAEFLSHRSGDLAEALSHHRALLETEPTHAPSLRVLMRLSRERDDDGALGVGLAIVRALGIAAPHEQEEEAPVTAPSFAGDRCLTDPLREKLRRLANKAAKEIATALDSAKRSPEAPSPEPASTFRAAARAAEGELTASALLPLDDVELAEVLKLAATLALDPDQVEGDGRLVNAMATAIRRGTARRLRKILNGTSLEEINATDIAAWRIDVRALAAAVAVDETGADLRTALMVLIAEAGEHDESDLATNADLTPFVAAHPLPRALLRRAVHTWLEKL
ncbi:MAG: tetratricopeptide repeat protein, partial [Myxococcota bacterium]